PSAIATADINGDGKTDLVTADNDSRTISVLIGQANGSFQTRVFSATPKAPKAQALADFDGDCKLDIAIACRENNLSIMRGNCDGSFQLANNYTAENFPLAVAAGDFNGDNHPDVVAVGGEEALIFLNNGSGGFQTPLVFTIGDFARSVAVADLNHDGKLD